MPATVMRLLVRDIWWPRLRDVAVGYPWPVPGVFIHLYTRTKVCDATTTQFSSKNILAEETLKCNSSNSLKITNIWIEMDSLPDTHTHVHTNVHTPYSFEAHSTLMLSPLPIVGGHSSVVRRRPRSLIDIKLYCVRTVSSLWRRRCRPSPC